MLLICKFKASKITGGDRCGRLKRRIGRSLARGNYEKAERIIGRLERGACTRH